METKNKISFLLEYALVRLVFWMFSSIPLSLGRRGGAALGRFLGRVVKRRTLLASDNVARAFPDTPPDQVRAIVAQSWENLGIAMAEFTHLPALDKDAYFDLVTVTGLEDIEKAYRKGKGVILFTAHYTNWEYAQHFLPLLDYPTAVIARRMKNPYVDAFITAIRTHFGAEVFWHKNAVKESIRWLRAGNVLGMLFDQRITDGGVKVPFLGRPAHTTILPAFLALRLGVPVLPAHCWREGGKLRVHVSPEVDLDGLTMKEEDVREATARMTRVVDEWIRERPGMWLWIHDRWK
ncbi:MAG TPA: lysophospholipid acyltransferase family protein [Elusimicrobiota bacterium]|nr:lysophospholipid acyltransferase family protein [Elusimicrobiota bacterium]